MGRWVGGAAEAADLRRGVGTARELSHDERGHQQAPARGVDGEDSTKPKAGPVLVRMREELHVCWLLTRSCVLT